MPEAMAFKHACFLSFPTASGNATAFAEHFYEELNAQLLVYDRDLSVFKYDRREHERRGANWQAWVQRELCHSATLVAICSPSYFSGSPACIAEFHGMEQLVAARDGLMASNGKTNWIIATRLRISESMSALDPYKTVDFLDCATTPKRVRTVRANRDKVADIVNSILAHWEYVNEPHNLHALKTANLCDSFALPRAKPAKADAYPTLGGGA